MTKNQELSNRYGLHIYNADQNKQFPYFVREWDECFTEEEIKENLPDWWTIECLEMGDIEMFEDRGEEFAVDVCPYCGNGLRATDQEDIKYCKECNEFICL